MEKILVSIIIVNWNTRDLILNCLKSIQTETKISYEIFVIDNGSIDGSSEMIRANFPSVRLINNESNRGFAAANNQGLELSKGQFVLLLNPDTVILNSAIDRTINWLTHRPEVGCVGCQVMESPDVIQQTCFADPGPLNIAITELGLEPLSPWIPLFGKPWYRTWDRKSEKEVEVVSGMFMLVPRKVLEIVGPLDPAFFVYAEEADWCKRIRSAGFKCVFAPVAQILHLEGGGKSTKQIKPRMHVQMQKSLLIYTKKHHGIAGWLIIKILFTISSFFRMLVFGILGIAWATDKTTARYRLAKVALFFQLTGKEPK
jgi:GT2 family glycosyltransferase